MSAAAKLFHAAYVTLYVLVYIVLIALVISVPADIIRQSIRENVTFNILVVAVCCVATVLTVAFIYATRLYISRSVIASIPKPWIPIEKGDMKKHVRKMIVAGLSRSAAIAYAARPRVAPPVFPAPLEDAEGEEVRPGLAEKEKKYIGPFRLKKAVSAEDEMGISLPPLKAVWGDIEHPGWSSPTSPDLPDLQYEPVIAELPNLIEAKAITLAPPDGGTQADPPMLDPEAVELLQRTEEMGLREYLTHLIELRVLEASPTTGDFITQYEYARFSTRPLSNHRFRELMHLFAEILRNMQPLDPAVLTLPPYDNSNPPESDLDNDAPQHSHSSTPSIRSHMSIRTNVSPSASSRTASIQTRLKPPPTLQRDLSTNTWQQYRTAPTTPQKTKLTETGSIVSSRSVVSGSRSGSEAGSVIRLSNRDDDTDLPYVLSLAETRASTY
ncbi:hypothetical protein DL546_006631 [Coniochaeta pulveracea]|uniref:Defect at low temperature protein 1 n=1 Tax=Coniochaeta pulveracea TaxID=177199 RepID=A0A420YGH8_9PEZI|nr:hypothetical protein DL546_006631 [Coniochaeta pulveracea]